MAGLTLADLWRETRAVVARHRNVLLTLGAATVFLPNAALRLLAPDMAGPGFDPTKPVVVPPGFWLLMVTVIMLQLVGVFAIGAITADSHEGGGRTLGRILGDAVPSLGRFLLALIVFFGVYFVGSIIFGLVLAIFVSAGVPLGISGGPGAGPAPMAFAALILAIFIPLGVWLWARLVPLVGVYLREPVGVIAGIRRAWKLSSPRSGRSSGWSRPI